MTKDVLIAIRGLHFEGDLEENKIETITNGEYYKRNGNHYIIFEEVTEGFSEPTKNVFKIKERELNLSKKGLVNVQMLFEEKKKNLTNYATPYGNVVIGIDTKKIDVEEKEERMMVNVDYALEINYEYLADCQITMDIRSKENAAFKL